MAEWREINAQWIGEDAFEATNARGVSIQLGNLENQPGVGPMEVLLMGLAGCTGMDITSILRKERQDLQKFVVKVRALRSDEYPKIYTDIEVTYLLWGNDLDRKAVERAIELSEEKYCSVGLMLGKAAKIVSAYRLLAPGETVESQETITK